MNIFVIDFSEFGENIKEKLKYIHDEGSMFRYLNVFCPLIFLYVSVLFYSLSYKSKYISTILATRIKLH